MPARLRRTLGALLLSLAAPAAAEPLTLVVLGDAPNGPPERVLPLFDSLIAEIDAAKPALVIHVGDLRGGRIPCDDAFLAGRRALLDRIDAPVLLTPGDNDWTDCWFPEGGGADPRERLAALRAAFFDPPGAGLGRRSVEAAHQGAAGFPENRRLSLDPLTVATIHVVGSNNGFEPRDPDAAAEFRVRDAAARAWLAETAAEAVDRGATALLIAIHADMFGEGFQPATETWVRHSGFAAFGPALRDAAAAFGGPVLLVHGDGHRFGLSQPFRRGAPGLLALEVFGPPEVNAVEVRVDPDRAVPFAVRPLRAPSQAP